MSQTFMPHGMCYLWRPDLLALHVISDAAIALAYFSIPLAIVYFARHRQDFQYRWVLALFAAFIVACGITHLLAIWVVWNPDYWLDGTAKAVTAGVSVLTAALLWPLLPKLLALPSPTDLRTANQSLAHEIEERIEAQEKLEKLNRELEARVTSRTTELENSNKELEQLAYNASHDLKAPLRAIHQLSQWIAEELPDNPGGEITENLGLMQSRISRMQRMLDDLLEYARVGADREQADTTVSKLVADVVLLAAPPERFTINVDLPPDEISINRVPLEQVLLNLVNNAIKHHDREDGRIDIRVRETSSELVFSVADDGPGIAGEYHAAIFDTFRTLQRKDDTESSGIGLAIVRRAVKQAGGSVSLESSDGDGATFTVRWPKHQ